MADFDGNLTPIASWDDVPLLSTLARALGGAGGPMNAQAQALLNRFAALGLGAGSTRLGYNRGSSGCLDLTAAKKFLTVRHCSDWGIKCDGTDETTKLQAMATAINAIPNTSGYPVKVVFSGQGDGAASTLAFTASIQFTRPVELDGSREVYISYTGTGNAFEFGPSTLIGDFVSATDVNIHKYYSAVGFGASGGTTSKACFYFQPWILYPRVIDCRFEAFGGNGSWAVYCQFNNWSVYVKDCEFWGKTNSTGDNANKRNFVGCPGALAGGTRDEFATRLNAIDNWVYSGGWTTGGIAYLISGWKSRIHGGGIEGPNVGVIVGAGCNDVELSGVYWESLFANSPTVPRFLQLSYSGDPYYPTYPFVKRLRINDQYCNMHNNDSLASNGRFLICENNVKLVDPAINGLTLVHNAFPVLELPDIVGHSGLEVNGVRMDGNISAQTYLLMTGYAGTHKASFATRIKNHAKLFDFSDIVSSFSAQAAPFSTNFGIATMTMAADGTGGTFAGGKTASDNTSGTLYERHRIGQQLNYGKFECTAAASGQTYITLNISLDAKLMELQGEDIIVSFIAKAYNAKNVLMRAIHNFSGPAIATEAINTQTIIAGDWFNYAFKISVPEMPAGTAVSNTAQTLTLVFPAGTTFSVGIASLMVHKGQIAFPLWAAA
jgi:hypothetical protein